MNKKLRADPEALERSRTAWNTWKFNPTVWNWTSVPPVGLLAPFLYFEATGESLSKEAPIGGRGGMNRIGLYARVSTRQHGQDPETQLVVCLTDIHRRGMLATRQGGRNSMNFFQ